MHAICAQLQLIFHIIRCPGYIQRVPAGENRLGSVGEISPQMLPCFSGKRSGAARRRASPAHGGRCGDRHGRFPAARRGLAARQGGATSCGVLQWRSFTGKELLTLSGEETLLCRGMLERAGFTVALQCFMWKIEERGALVGRFPKNPEEGRCPHLLQTKIDQALDFL